MPGRLVADNPRKKGGSPMLRKFGPPLAVLLLLVGCAGPAKLTQQSQQKLAAGDPWSAWRLATRALDKQQGNPAARAAATRAGGVIAQDWERRIHALADVDTLRAADQVITFAEFRANAARYATIPVSAAWPGDEQALRTAAAQTCYVRGSGALDSKRPKRAWEQFTQAESYLGGYRDATRRADRAMELAITRVAVLPLRASGELSSIGAQVAGDWREELARTVVPRARFTRVLGGDAIDRVMTVSELSGLTRDAAVRLGRKAGAQRIVWASIGNVTTTNHVDLFEDTIARRVVDKDPTGRTSERWVGVPINVIARVRDVTVTVNYDLVSTRDGATLAHQRFGRATSARAVWTSYQPEGELSAYSLVSTVERSADPDRAKKVEARWSAVCGAGTTLQQVLSARRSSTGDSRYDRSSLPRFIEGAAFVFLSDLPPTNDLAYAALAKGACPLKDDLLRLDDVDDVDLAVQATSSNNP